MNGERRVQRVRRAVAPPDGAHDRLGDRVRRRPRHGRGRALRVSKRRRRSGTRSGRCWPAGAGITYARLDRGGLQWPCPTEDHPGTTMLHEHRFAHGPRATLRCIEPQPLAEEPSAEYPFVLVTGRHLYQFNAGTMTGRTGNAILRPQDVLEMSPADAERLSFAEGDVVEIESRHGQARLPVHVDSAIQAGQLFATFHSPAAFVNRVTGSARDPITHTPEYKRTAVRIRAIA